MLSLLKYSSKISIAWMAGVAGMLAAQTPGPSDPSSASPTSAGPASAEPAENAVAVAASDLSSLDRLLPVGKTARKVTVPTVDEEGLLTSVVTMGSITRLDEDNFSLEKVVMTSYDEAASASSTAERSRTVIRLLSARYHAPTRVLVSDEPVTIQKPTLFMSGDSLRYDSAAGRAVIKGNAKALIMETPRVEPDPEPDEAGDDLDEEDDEVVDDSSKKELAPAPPTPKRP
jgi:hypothetical protein